MKTLKQNLKLNTSAISAFLFIAISAASLSSQALVCQGVFGKDYKPTILMRPEVDPKGVMQATTWKTTDKATVEQAVKKALGANSESIIPKNKKFLNLVAAVEAKSLQSGKNSYETAEILTILKLELAPALKKLKKEDRSWTDFLFASRIVELEEVAAKDTRIVEKDFVKNKGPEMKDFYKFTKSYVKKSGIFTTTDLGWNLLALRDIRDLEALNAFPLTLKDHDIHHIHFAAGHPRILTPFWGAARSKNNLRYFLMGGFFESVDTTQYSWESNLARLLKDRGYNIESGLLYLASATKAELEAINSEIGGESTFTKFEGYVPPSYDVKKTRTFAEDRVKIMSKLWKELAKPENKKILNYNVSVPDGGVAVDNLTPLFN